MHQDLNFAVWNANGLCLHAQELKIFIKTHNLDIVLVSETHFTDRSYFNIPQFSIYSTNFPDNTAHGGAAVIINNKIKHYELPEHKEEHLQAASVMVQSTRGDLAISAIYCPPKFSIKQAQFENFFQNLGNKFIAGGDYNAKHVAWGSRLITPRGRELLNTIKAGNMQYVSTGEPTYWPTDLNKIPDLLDFCITKGIAPSYMQARSCLDLSSDHTPILVTNSTQYQQNSKPPSLYNSKTNWEKFRYTLKDNLNFNVKLKNEKDIDEAIEHLTNQIQKAAWASTPSPTSGVIKNDCPEQIKIAVAQKRKLRRIWQNQRTPFNKAKLNQATNRLKNMLKEIKNLALQNYLENLTATEVTDYSLWRATRKIKKTNLPIPPIRKTDNSWARSDKEKADTFAEHLSNVFKPHESTITQTEENEISEFLVSAHQLSLPIKSFHFTDIENTVHKHINIKKAPGYDLINGRVLRELPCEGIKFIKMTFNAILRLGYYPQQWKAAQIIVIPKPGKAPEHVESYRPISLLPILSKVFEKLLLQKLLPILKHKNIIPDHQFGFRMKHGTIEQIHRVVNKITQSIEKKQYCSAAFLDIAQAFDKVWHKGLLYKLKKILPNTFYDILRSYLNNRYFQVKFKQEYSNFYPIESGVPQGSVLGPLLYLIFTADLPTTDETLTSTFADDTAVLASHEDPLEASHMLQFSLDKIQNWLSKWRIKANETKSVHITFTTKRNSCPIVKLNNIELPEAESAKYLGMHLDRRLTWRKHIATKRKQLQHKFLKIYWLIGKKSHLTLENKILLYKVALKPIWTYGIQLWGTASKSSINILQRFQSKTLRTITKAPWYVNNNIIHEDLNIPTVQGEIKKWSEKYLEKLNQHPNHLAVSLLDNSTETRRLKRHTPLELPQRFSDS